MWGQSPSPRDSLRLISNTTNLRGCMKRRTNCPTGKVGDHSLQPKVGKREKPPTFRLGDCGRRAGCRAVGKSERSPTFRLGDCWRRAGCRAVGKSERSPTFRLGDCWRLASNQTRYHSQRSTNFSLIGTSTRCPSSVSMSTTPEYAPGFKGLVGSIVILIR
jgi:hypothetical protein